MRMVFSLDVDDVEAFETFPNRNPCLKEHLLVFAEEGATSALYNLGIRFYFAAVFSQSKLFSSAIFY